MRRPLVSFQKRLFHSPKKQGFMKLSAFDRAFAYGKGL